MPDLSDPRPGYVGRAPDMQPQLGETGIGGGTWNCTSAQNHWGPYQRFITGVDHVDGKWLEYVVPVEKATPNSKGEISFDGYIPEPGPPPVYQAGPRADEMPPSGRLTVNWVPMPKDG